MIFELNKYLRNFIRDDLTSEYENKCLKIVDKYKDKKSTEVIIDMFSEFNAELLNLGHRVLEEQEKHEKTSQ